MIHAAMAGVKQIFISHAHEDREFAHRLAQDLTALGFLVWIAPESIQPGESWVDGIEHGLEGSSHVVLVLSQAACLSSWVKKEMEVAIAQERKGMMKVIPLDVSECKPPLLWGSYQKATFRGEYQKGFTALCGMLTALPGAAPGAAPKAAAKAPPAAPPAAATQAVPAPVKPRQEAPRQPAKEKTSGHAACDVCGKTFATAYYLDQHKAKAHTFNEWAPFSTASSADQASVLATCELCGKTFASKKNLEQHKADKHPSGGKTSPAAVRPAAVGPAAGAAISTDATSNLAICLQCGKSFSSQEFLNQHVASAHQFFPNKCSQCGKVFLSGKLLEQHVASEHRLFPHTCPHCGKPFANRPLLEQHIKIMHKR